MTTPVIVRVLDLALEKIMHRLIFLRTKVSGVRFIDVANGEPPSGALSPPFASFWAVTSGFSNCAMAWPTLVQRAPHGLADVGDALRQCLAGERGDGAWRFVEQALAEVLAREQRAGRRASEQSGDIAKRAVHVAHHPAFDRAGGHACPVEVLLQPGDHADALRDHALSIAPLAKLASGPSPLVTLLSELESTPGTLGEPGMPWP